MQTQESKWLVVPQGLQSPAINPRLEELSPVVRSAECLRHFVMSAEYWLSPSGRLRCWLKINLVLGVGLFIPAVVLMPVISVVLHELDGWLSTLLGIIWKFILLSVLVFIVPAAIKHFPSSSPGSSRRR